jgi:hypothetical protein
MSHFEEFVGAMEERSDLFVIRDNISELPLPCGESGVSNTSTSNGTKSKD